VWLRSGALDRVDEPVAAPGHCFDIPRFFRRIAQYRPQAPDGGIDAVIEIDGSVAVPQEGLDVLAEHEFTGVSQQVLEDFERLLLQPHTDAVLSQLSGAGIQFERPETVARSGREYRFFPHNLRRNFIINRS
jgi:hypothetical protein